MQTITIGSNTYGLCTIPANPGPADVEIGMSDTVAAFQSPFNKVEQLQPFAGADAWDATVTLPPLTRAQASDWRGFLAELQGRRYVFQLGDPTAASPLGTVRGTPVVDTTNPDNNNAMATTLVTRGWLPSSFRLLLRGDQLQIGYRMHMVTANVQSDAAGAATLQIWPSLREQPADGTALVFKYPRALFRLAQNRRSIHWSPRQLTTVSLQCVEAR